MGSANGLERPEPIIEKGPGRAPGPNSSRSKRSRIVPRRCDPDNHAAVPLAVSCYRFGIGPTHSGAGDPQSDTAKTASHSGHDHTFGVLGGWVIASIRCAHSVTSASQCPHRTMLLVSNDGYLYLPAGNPVRGRVARNGRSDTSLGGEYIIGGVYYKWVP